MAQVKSVRRRMVWRKHGTTCMYTTAIYMNTYHRLHGNLEEKDGVESLAGSEGVTYELCAGIVDKDVSLKEIAQSEILEEVGFQVPLEKIEEVTSYRGNVGVAGSLQTLFYAEVTDDMRVSTGGGVQEEGEMIEVVELPLGDSRKFIMDSSINRPGLLLFAFMWFYDTKMGKK
ncbi:uridine diphosphate glucose pyrophosphatase NUDT14-like isoform X3 [Branchiostoma lanceolatum]|uniref:uridine diphosphate glucose pyrophosphatase NUDT14-like isoform X3 n=1 Tax=Branchiostoma lanceolatum TaxID=7740 RepID=UPI0034555D98